MYRIEARIVFTNDVWTGSVDVPTFYVGDDQGCSSAAHALRVAKRIIDPFDDYVVHATAYDQDTGDYAATEAA